MTVTRRHTVIEVLMTTFIRQRLVIQRSCILSISRKSANTMRAPMLVLEEDILNAHSTSNLCGSSERFTDSVVAIRISVCAIYASFRVIYGQRTWMWTVSGLTDWKCLMQ